MMLFPLGKLSDTVNELHRLNKPGKSPVTHQLTVFESPFGQLTERLVNFIALEDLLV